VIAGKHRVADLAGDAQTHPSAPMHSDAYRPDVDGLRAIAVLPVIAYHAFPRLLPGGFVGVDIFFVISGFLISSIILKGLNDGRFSFLEFYGRRIKRIFPALIVILATCLPLGWMILFPDELRGLGKHTAAAAAFAYNIVAWSEIGYFDPDSVTKPFLHLWSLGVEEQFYAVWPLVLVLAFRWRAAVPWVVGTLLLASFALNIALIDQRPVETFYFPVTRLWELATGSLLACVVASKHSGGSPVAPKPPKRRQVNGRALLAWAALLGIGASVLLLDTRKAFPGWWALLPTLSATVLIATGPDTWLHRRLLAHRLPVFIGLISYPLYLWHWPLLSFAHIIEGGVPSVTTRLTLVGAGFVLAWLTYVAVEIPIRFRGRTGPRAIALASIMCLLGAMGILVTFNRVPSRYSPDRVAYMDFFENSAPAYRAFLRYADAYRDECNFRDFRRNQPRTAIDRSCYTPHSAKTVLIWGDSHGQQYFHGLKSALPADYSILQVATAGCTPSLKVINATGYEYCNRSNQFALRVVGEVKPRLVILAQAQKHQRTDWRGFSRALKDHGAGKVVLLGPVPHWKPSLNKVIASAYWENTPTRIATHLDEGVIATDWELTSRYMTNPDLTYVSMIARLCDANGCLTHLNGDRKNGIFTWDMAHLTPPASDYVASRFIAPVVIDAVDRGGFAGP
jgi:peptidoglycan/LPS O-acetylase OafA/YrhL